MARPIAGASAERLSGATYPWRLRTATGAPRPTCLLAAGHESGPRRVRRKSPSARQSGRSLPSYKWAQAQPTLLRVGAHRLRARTASTADPRALPVLRAPGAGTQPSIVARRQFRSSQASGPCCQGWAGRRPLVSRDSVHSAETVSRAWAAAEAQGDSRDCMHMADYVGLISCPPEVLECDGRSQCTIPRCSQNQPVSTALTSILGPWGDTSVGRSLAQGTRRRLPPHHCHAAMWTKHASNGTECPLSRRRVAPHYAANSARGFGHVEARRRMPRPFTHPQYKYAWPTSVAMGAWPPLETGEVLSLTPPPPTKTEEQVKVEGGDGGGGCHGPGNFCL